MSKATFQCDLIVRSESGLRHIGGEPVIQFCQSHNSREDTIARALSGEDSPSLLADNSGRLLNGHALGLGRRLGAVSNLQLLPSTIRRPGELPFLFRPGRLEFGLQNVAGIYQVLACGD